MRRREVLGEPGNCHWRIRRVEMLAVSSDLRSSELDFNFRLDELRVMVSTRRTIGTSRRGCTEVVAFRTFQNNSIGMLDLSLRPVATQEHQQAPFQINR